MSLIRKKNVSNGSTALLFCFIYTTEIIIIIINIIFYIQLTTNTLEESLGKNDEYFKYAEVLGHFVCSLFWLIAYVSIMALISGPINRK